MSSFTPSDDVSGDVLRELEDMKAQIGIVRDALLRSSKESSSDASTDSACKTVRSFGGLWQSPDVVQLVKSLKQYAKGCGDLCTRIGVMGVASMQKEIKESVYAELLPYVRNSLGCYMSLVHSGGMGSPLFNQITNALRSLIELVIDVVKIVESKVDTGLKSAVGMVWEAVDAVQKLPESNKAAYRRYVMKNVGIIEETASEFRAYLDESTASPHTPAAAEEGRGEDDDEEEEEEDGFAAMLEDMAAYGPEEAAVVEGALKRMHLARELLKSALVCMSEFGEYVTARSGAVASDCSGWPVWIESVAACSAKVQTAVVDLGAELYHPIDEKSVHDLESQLDEVVSHVVSLISEPPSLGAEVEYVVNAVEKYGLELNKISSF